MCKPKLFEFFIILVIIALCGIAGGLERPPKLSTNKIEVAALWPHNINISGSAKITGYGY